jgi:putative flippase GtrA
MYERFRHLIHEFAKFGVIGIFGLFVTNGVYDLLYNQMHWGPVKSTTVATIVAAVCTYVGNRYWSFRHRERPGVLREAVVFFVLNGIGLLIQDAAVAFNYYVLGLGSNKAAGFVALNFGIGVATLFRFWSYRRFVWMAPAAAEADPVAAAVAVAATDGAEAKGFPPAGQFPAEPRAGGIPSQAAPPVTRANGHQPASHRANGNGGRAFGDPAGRPSGSRLRD